MRVLVTMHSRVTENDASRMLPLDGSLMVKMFFDVVLHLTRCLKSGKLGSRISDGAHGSSGLVCSYDLNWFEVGARMI